MIDEGLYVSFECGGKHIWEFLCFFSEGSLYDDSINIFQIGYFFQRIIFSIIFQYFIERIANQESVLELRQFSQLIQLVPTFNLII